jgi:hypothetical protein
MREVKEKIMDNRIEFNCPGCGKKIKLKNVSSGQVVDCDVCGTAVQFLNTGCGRIGFIRIGTVKSPLGLKPKYIADEERKKDIISATQRYLEAGKKIPIEWIEEYNEIAESRISR